MYINRINCKKLSLWVFILAQLFLITLYYYVQKGEKKQFYNEGISFLSTENLQSESGRTYHIEGDSINLAKYKVKGYFVDFNSSLCFVNGTDLISMTRSKNSWACNCKIGWHGMECGQPEVVWRALLTYRKRLEIKGPKPLARRLLYIFQVDEFTETLCDIRVNELHKVIDLFVLIENQGNKIEKLLNNGFLKKYHKQILYLKDVALKDVWKIITSSVSNLEHNDIILVSRSFEIPHKFTLGFLKYYDHWPEPILFRLRWSVFGFFWKHPNKTKTEGVACSVKFIKKVYDSNFENLFRSKDLSGLVFGDLNHYGGWYCEYCMDPLPIIKFVTMANLKNLNWNNLNKIDTNYIEDLIGNGLYIDGKTELERSRKYHDNYFAPDYVLDNSLIYDFLLLNLYSKLDYYEG